LPATAGTGSGSSGSGSGSDVSNTQASRDDQVRLTMGPGSAKRPSTGGSKPGSGKKAKDEGAEQQQWQDVEDKLLVEFVPQLGKLTLKPLTIGKHSQVIANRKKMFETSGNFDLSTKASTALAFCTKIHTLHKAMARWWVSLSCLFSCLFSELALTSGVSV
jgi:hypothetical protein